MSLPDSLNAETAGRIIGASKLRILMVERKGTGAAPANVAMAPSRIAL